MLERYPPYFTPQASLPFPKGYAPEEPETQGWMGGGAVNEGLPKFSDLQKMWGYKVF